MAYRVRLELFEGPLDLLLHLIKKNEVAISDIPIATITDQYLTYMDMLKEMNLDVAGEFLVMAATLMHIKVRALLPEPEDGTEEADEAGDPRAELIARLQEYQRFREAAFELGQRSVLRRDVFSRPRHWLEDDGELKREPGEIRDASLGALLDALRQVLRRAQAPAIHEVTAAGLSIHDCFGPMLECLRARGRCSFEGLFPPGVTRHRVIVTFLAVLELMRLGVAHVEQDREFGELEIVLAVASVEAAKAIIRECGYEDLTAAMVEM